MEVIVCVLLSLFVVAYGLLLAVKQACLNTVCTNTLIRSCLFCSPLLSISDVSNGSSGMKPASSMGGSVLSLTNKTTSLNLCSADQAASSSDHQKNGVVHSCS